MRPKSIILLALALGCGVVASIGITQVMAKRGTDPAQPEVETILVAMNDIPMGDPVSPQMVKLEEWPRDKVPKGAVKTLEDLENRRPKTRIFAGSPILDNQLLGKGMLDQGASDSIPKGMRVIAVKVDLVSGSASLIRPGDRVDLLVHLHPAGGGDLSRTVTKTILQDVKVFAVDNVWDAAGTSGEKALVAKTVSLLVTPAQAEKVTLASEMGTVRLIMRSPNDKEQVSVSGAGAVEILGSFGGGSDRTPMIPTQAAGSFASGLLKLLDSKKPPKAAPGDPTPASPETKNVETFTVRILAGQQLNETVLEATDENNSGGSSETSFLRWRPSTSPPAATSQDRPSAKASTGATPDDDDDEIGAEALSEKPEKAEKPQKPEAPKK